MWTVTDGARYRHWREEGGAREPLLAGVSYWAVEWQEAQRKALNPPAGA